MNIHYPRGSMVTPPSRLVLLIPIFLIFTQSARSETIDDCLVWPPVFERCYGTPTIKVKTASVSRPKINFIRPAKLVIIKVPKGCSKGQIHSALKTYFLNLTWCKFLDKSSLSENELRLNMGELVPISRRDFLKIGHCQLSGKSCGNRLRDNWWKVRTGMALRKNCDHLLAVSTLEWDDPDKKSFGHFAFALRKRGGDVNTDRIFDFRAPWYEDRRPRFTEGPNIHNVLKLKAVTENLYDWLYTQTEYRNSHVTMCFVEIHDEQVSLLRAYNVDTHEAGNFRVFKKNCASLGTQFINRLLPLDRKIKGENAFADLPLKAYEATVAELGGAVKEVKIENYTDDIGREPTNKSEIHRAQPSRTRSRPSKILCKIPEIN